MTSITVLCPNARRCTVKVTGNTSLSQVLEEACLKQGFDLDGHELRYHGRLIDGSVPVRLSGLTNNATVDLVPVKLTNSVGQQGEATAEIALQLNDGRRTQRTVSINATLWNTLEQLNPDLDGSLLDAGEHGRMVPACSYMNKQWKGQSELKSVSLKSIGIVRGSRALLRYSKVSVTETEMKDIEHRIEIEQERRKQMDVQYQARRADNQLREEEERQKMEEYERELLEQRHQAELKAKEAASAKVESADAVSEAAVVSQRRVPQKSNGQNTRMHQLQNILSQVNTSLNSNVEDFLADRLLTDTGAIPVSLLSNSQLHAGSNEFANFKFPDTPEPMDDQIIASDGESVTHQSQGKIGSVDRNPVLFTKRIAAEPRNEHSEPTSSTADVPQSATLDGAFYEISIADAQSIQRDRKNEVRQLNNAALLPKAYVMEKNRALKAAAYRHTVIRFQLSEDHLILQGRFLSIEPVSALYDFVSKVTASPTSNFVLALLTMQLDRKSQKNLLDANLAPTANLVVRFMHTAPDLVTKRLPVNSADEADESSREWLFTNFVFVPFNPVVESAAGGQTGAAVAKRQADNLGDESTANAGGGSRSVELPKWMRRQ